MGVYRLRAFEDESFAELTLRLQDALKEAQSSSQRVVAISHAYSEELLVWTALILTEESAAA